MLIVLKQWVLRYFIIQHSCGNWHPLQCSCLENPKDGGAYKDAVHGVAEGQTWLRDFTFTFYFHALEKEMATHFRILAWRIPGTGEPGGLPSVGSHRVGHDWSDLAAAAYNCILQNISIKCFRLAILQHVLEFESRKPENPLNLKWFLP